MKSPGLWSLSVYGADKNLIPNSLDRFEVGDRTYNLTHADGGYVYGPNANSSRDEPFQILLQSADVTPPKNWTNNWLPAEDSFYMLCEYISLLLLRFDVLTELIQWGSMSQSLR